MSMLWKLLGAIVVVIVLLIGAVFVIPADRLGGIVSDQLSKQLGRNVTLGDVKLSLYPILGVEVTQLEIANAAWSQSGPMMTADTARIGVDAMAAEIKKTMGGLSVMVNCAGGASAERFPAWETPNHIWDSTIARNLSSMFYTCRAVMPMLKASGKGRVVNVSSMTERSGGIVGSIAYTTSKGGVNAFTRALAKEAAPEVRVNAASPGLVDSPFHSDDARKLYPDLINRIPLGRIGDPIDLAGPILFLASDHAGYMTGEVIESSGGMRLR